jgi:hypothetical protein
MVQLTEVLDEEFVREQEGPHDEDDWDTDSGTSLSLSHPSSHTHILSPQITLSFPSATHIPTTNPKQNPTHPPSIPSPTPKPSTSASSRCKTSSPPPHAAACPPK